MKNKKKWNGLQAQMIRTTTTPAFWGYPHPNDYTILLIHIGSQVKTTKQFKVTNLKNLPKLQIFKSWKILYTRHTFWSCLISCVNMKWIWQMDRRMDGQMDKVKPVYPPSNFVEQGDIITTLDKRPISHSEFGSMSITLLVFRHFPH